MKMAKRKMGPAHNLRQQTDIPALGRLGPQHVCPCILHCCLQAIENSLQNGLLRLRLKDLRNGALVTSIGQKSLQLCNLRANFRLVALEQRLLESLCYELGT